MAMATHMLIPDQIREPAHNARHSAAAVKLQHARTCERDL